MSTYESEPTLCVKSMHHLLAVDPKKFSRAAFQLLVDKLPAGESYLLYLLMFGLNEDAVLNDLLDASRTQPDRARALAQSLGAAYQNLATRLLKHLNEEIRADSGKSALAERALELAGALPETRGSTPHLLELLRSSEPRVQSKATLLMARNNQAPRWAEEQLAEQDPRVRANAVEGMWGLKQLGAAQVLRTATRDSHQRVAVNAWIGLHYLGEADAADALINLASHDLSLFRAAAAWGMGHLGEAVFQPTLQGMVRDADPIVRRNVLRSLIKIRKKHKAAEPAVALNTLNAALDSA